MRAFLPLRLVALLAFAACLFAPVSRGQSGSTTAFYTVNFNFKLTLPATTYPEGFGGGVSIYDEETGTTVGSGIGGPSSTVPTTLVGQGDSATHLAPNKTYKCTVSGSIGATATVAFAPASVSGFKTYINGVAATSYSFTFTSTATSSIIDVQLALPNNYNLDPEPISLAAGAATSMMPDKPILYFGLGNMRNGLPAGVIGFRAQDFARASLFTPAALYVSSYHPTPATEVEKILVSAGGNSVALRQVRSREVLVDINTISSTSYKLEFYPASAAGSQSGGAGTPYAVSGSPFVTYTVSQDTSNGIVVTRLEDSVTWETNLALSGSTWTFKDWHKQGTTVNSNITTVYSSATAATVTANGPASGLAGYTDTSFSWSKSYTSYAWGLQLTNTTMGASTSVPLISNSAYYTTSAAVGSAGAHAGLVQWATNKDGTWSAYTYYVGNATTTTTIPDGYVQTVFRPWLDNTAADNTGSVAAAATTANSAHDVYQYQYVAKGTGATGGATEKVFLPSSVISYAPGGTQMLKKTTWSYNAFATTLNGRPVWSQTENAFSSASSSIATTSLFYVPKSTPDLLDNQPVSVTYPTGRKDSYAYFNGTWNSSTHTFTAGESGNDRLILCFHGQTAGGTALSSWTNNSITRAMDSVSMVGGYSTVSETVIDTTGRVVFTGQNVYTTSGTLERIAGLARTYDANCRLQYVTDIMRGSSTSPHRTQYSYTSRLLNSITNPDGTSTSYLYDDLLRQTQKTIGVTSLSNASTYPARVQATTYDGANRPVATFSCSCGTAPTIFYYDTAGRVSQKTEPSPNSGDLLLTSYTFDSLVKTTTTLPTGATTITTNYADGRPKSVTGTAQPSQYYEYAANSTGLQITRYNHTSANQANGWGIDQLDLLGRNVKHSIPAYQWSSSTNANNVIDVVSTYHATSGLLTKTNTTYRATGGQLVADRLYGYDGAGRLKEEGLDVNADGTLTAASVNDRYVTHALSYIKDTTGWTSVATTSSYPTGTALQISKTVTRLTGFSSTAGTNGFAVGEVAVTDINSQVTTQVEYVHAATLRHHIDVTRTGVSQAGWTETINGYEAETVSLDGARSKKEYDSLGRLVTIRSRWSGTAYAAADTVSFASTNYTTLPDSTTVDTVTTGYSYAWPGSGARIVTTTVTTAIGGSTTSSYTKYNAMGLPWRTGGPGASPTEYGYDDLGRLTSITTWRDGPYGEADWPTAQNPVTKPGDKTLWTIEPATGLSTRKTFADSNHVDFTFTPLGQPLVRTAARGVTTTYSYYDGSTTTTSDVSHRTQELRAITYSDGTPSVAYTYNRSGLPASVDDATTVGATLGHTFGYASAQPLRLTTETFSSYYGGRVATQSYDANFRPAGFTLSNAAQSGNDLSQIWTYDPASGLAKTLTTTPAGQTPASREFTYSFDPNTGLISGWSTGAGAALYKMTYGYETATNRRNQVRSTMGGDSNIIAEFNPSYDPRGLMQNVTQKGSAFGDYYTPSYTSVLNNYVYDNRGELKQAGLYRGNTTVTNGIPTAADELPGHKFIYSYDSMGNRTSAGESGATVADGGTDDSYAPNNLNQYTQKTNYIVRVVGTSKAMPPSGHVAVAAATSTNLVDHSWGASIVPNQGGNAASGPIAVYASIPGGAGGTDVIGFDGSKSYTVAPTPQVFQYDQDGNLTEDGLWHYTYDAENRLISIYHIAAAIGTGKIASANARKLVFTYDYLGRRVRKQVYGGWNGSTYSTTALTDRKFVYNGWNVVAEYDVLNASALKRSYTWGLDLTGSSTATGGVGALVELTDHTANKSYYPAYDQNGNVVALVNDGGSLAAGYEYSAFGEPMRADVIDATVADNPFRYSTKYTDVETGLVYYGLRYYTPSLGRFVNRDPIQEAGGLNLYGFCGNNPVSRWDVLGLMETVNDEAVELAPVVVSGSRPRETAPEIKNYNTQQQINQVNADVLAANRAGFSNVQTHIPTTGGSSGPKKGPAEKAASKTAAKTQAVKPKEETDCERFSELLAALATPDAIGGNKVAARYAVGTVMLGASFLHGTSFTVGNHTWEKPTRTTPSGFKPELTAGEQRSDVYHHVGGHAGATLMGGVGYGFSYKRELDDRWQLFRSTDPVRDIETRAEIAGNAAGRDVGEMMRESFGVNNGENREELAKKIKERLCQ